MSTLPVGNEQPMHRVHAGRIHKQEHPGDTLAFSSDEGRGKQRNATGTRWQGTIRRCPNGATHHLAEMVPGDGGKRGELKHLSSRRNRKQL
jgi:hypothetical protein